MGKRHIGVALDYSDSSKYALKWTMDNILKAGDHLILIVVNKDFLDDSQFHLWERSGSPLIPLNEILESGVERRYQLKHDEDICKLCEEAAHEKITVMAKVYWGDPKQKICDAVADCRLDSLVMGSRGFGPVKRTLLGSVSTYAVSNVLCPVTVVKMLPNE